LFISAFTLFILTLLTSLSEPSKTNLLFSLSSETSFAISLAFYFAIVLAIIQVSKNENFTKNRSLLFTNVALCFYFIFYYQVLKADNFWYDLLPSLYSTLTSLWMYSLYFLGLFLHLYIRINYKRHRQEDYSLIFFLFPFIIPYLLVTFSIDFSFLINPNLSTYYLGFIVLGISIVSLIAFPYIIQKIWQTEPIQDPILKDKFTAICHKCQFSHGGIKNWTIMKSGYTAAIVGLVSKFRYIIFTPRILKDFSHDELEAILIHEIGHHHYRHLFYYPLIFLGLLIIFLLISPFVDNFSIPNTLQLAIYIPLIVIYVRFIYGFFSRNFERQADSYIATIGYPVDHLITALDHVGKVTGNTHNHPNWHHYSIQERINFLNAIKENPKVIEQLNYKIKFALLIYLSVLILFLLLILWINNNNLL